MALTHRTRQELEEAEATYLAALENVKQLQKDIITLRDGIVMQAWMQRACNSLDEMILRLREARNAIIVELYDVQQELTK